MNGRTARSGLIFAALLLAAPFLWTGSFALSLLSQMGIAIIACLAYNVLLGQGGMLSFGHAVYSGLGAYAAIHVLNAVGAGQVIFPISLLPLVGGVAGLSCAALFGYVCTRKSGTPFAMITLGLGELIWALSLMLPAYFGGEGGISGNRVQGEALWGWLSFGPQIQVYYLIALYCLVCTALLYAFTGTPLGRLLNAVREQPERLGFIGFDARQVRYRAFMVSGFFAGIAGGLAALNFEIVTPEVLGAGRSGAYLLFTVLGGSSVFFGPIIGGILMVLAGAVLSTWTPASGLYLGLLFMAVVMWVPGGLAAWTLWRPAGVPRPVWRRHWRAGLLLALALPLAALSFGALVDMAYQRQQQSALGSELRFLGVPLDSASAWHWCALLALCCLACALSLGAKQALRRALTKAWAP